MPEANKEFDLIVIGGGSGGLAAAKRSAEYGARVAVVESSRWGGTCVNVGCVPKKILYNTAHVYETVRHEASQFGVVGSGDVVKFDWQSNKTARDNYIKRLNGIYEAGLSKLGIVRVSGLASFAPPSANNAPSSSSSSSSSADSIRVQVKSVSGETCTLIGKHVVVAVGGEPSPLGIPGEEFATDSNGFFALEEQPKNVAVIGAGYIAVELAGVLNALGTKTSLFVRGNNALRTFDSMLQSALDEQLRKSGVKGQPDLDCFRNFGAKIKKKKTLEK